MAEVRVEVGQVWEAMGVAAMGVGVRVVVVMEVVG